MRRHYHRGALGVILYLLSRTPDAPRTTPRLPAAFPERVVTGSEPRMLRWGCDCSLWRRELRDVSKVRLCCPDWNKRDRLCS